MAKIPVRRFLKWLLAAGLMLAVILFLLLEGRKVEQESATQGGAKPLNEQIGTRKVKQESATQGCKQNLQRLAQAFITYRDVHGSLPPAYLADKEGRPAHSWRVLLLPFLGRQDLYAAYRFDEPWDGPNNRKLADKLHDIYTCPGDGDSPPWRTNYVAVISSQTVWPGSIAVRFEDITDGLSTTILLVETGPSDIHWMEPRDLRMADLIPPGSRRIGLRFNSMHPPIRNVLFCDGSVHNLSGSIGRRLLYSLLTRAQGDPFRGQWLPGEQVADASQFPPEMDAERLKATDVSPHLEGRIVPGRNYLYCATFQLAWDELRKKIGAPLQVEGDLPLAAALNRRPFPRNALAPESCLARMGAARDGTLDSIRAEMRQKFPGVTPSLLESNEPAVLVSYAFLQKSLPFKKAFDALNEPLVFHETVETAKVANFGVKELEGDFNEIAEQVVVLDHLSDDDFVLALRPEKDEIILAKVKPRATAAATLQAVQQRIRAQAGKIARPSLEKKETLIVPTLAFSILRRYGDLTDKYLRNPQWHDLRFLEPRQSIRFMLNESGASLESQSAQFFANGHAEPPRPRKLIFDRPFLLYLKEKQAEDPYLVLWVENAELMQPADAGGGR